MNNAVELLLRDVTDYVKTKEEEVRGCGWRVGR